MTTVEQIEEMFGMKPQPKEPPSGATIEELIWNMKHNSKVKENKNEYTTTGRPKGN